MYYLIETISEKSIVSPDTRYSVLMIYRR